MFRLLSCFLLLLALTSCSIKPEPLTKMSMQMEAGMNLFLMYDGQENISGKVTLEEAIARGVMYNLDNRVKMMEEAIALGVADLSSYDLLPQLTAKAGYTSRSKYSGATSMSLLTGNESLVASTSQEKLIGTNSLGVSWNILDLGVSYATAKQSNDQRLIAEQLRRKSIQNIVADIQTAWWRAVVAQKLSQDIEEAIVDANKELDRYEMLEKKKLIPLETAISSQKQLVSLLKQLRAMKRESDNAMIHLASLMNLKPGERFSIAVPQGKITTGMPDVQVEHLELLSLINRPELHEAAYNKRISVWETKKTFLKLFPGIDLSADYKHDGNKYTYYNDWNEVGVRLSWNLFNIFTFFDRYKLSKAREELEGIKSMALSMATIAQLHLALQAYQESLGDYRLSKREADLEIRMTNITNLSRQVKRTNRLEEILGKTRELNAKMSAGLAMAQLQDSISRVYSTIGIDQAPLTINSRELAPLAKEIRGALDVREKSLTSKLAEVYGKPVINTSNSNSSTQNTIQHPRDSKLIAQTKESRNMVNTAPLP